MAGSTTQPTLLATLFLDGGHVGRLDSFEGGMPSGEVVTVNMGGEVLPRKHLSATKYEDIVVQLPFPPPEAVRAWVSSMMTGAGQSKSGAIVFTNRANKHVRTLEFFDALLSEVTFPALDAKSKDQASLTLRIKTERTRLKFTGTPPAASGPKTKKVAVVSNFRFEITGLEAKRVSKVDALTVKQAITTTSVGDLRDFELTPARLELPNLRLMLAEIDFEPWYQWLDDFVVKGNNSPANEKTGSLVYLDTNLSKELARINFSGLGIFRLTPDRVGAPASDSLRRMTAELYCEGMNLVLPPP